MNEQCHTNTSLANRYHGLMNQGSTCYLNSVLQVLFLTKDFREAVKKYSIENPHSEFLDHDLKTLFDDLQNYTTYTYKITKKLGIDNVNEQQNAAEYFERILRMTSPDASEIFHGQLANKTTCSKGHIQTDGDAPFWYLHLSLVDSCSGKVSVVKGIEEFFKTSDFCGENQMYCEQCDHKVDATMRDVIKYHPDVLCLLLKRFEFNYNYMSYIKINCDVDVPYTLQIPENQKYELYAVVDHFGDLRGGHYTATIKMQEEHGDRWHHFHDTRVTELVYQPFQLDNTERSQTAYLLFYRKSKDAAAEVVKEMCSLAKPNMQVIHEGAAQIPQDNGLNSIAQGLPLRSSKQLFPSSSTGNSGSPESPRSVSICRIKVVEDLLVVFKDKSIMTVTLKMDFVNERAIDDAGVSREVYTAFWEQFLEQCEGETERVPRLRPDFCEAEWQAVGQIWVKGLLDHGVIPVRLSKAFILACLHGIDSVSIDILMTSFLNYIAPVERSAVENALQGTMGESDEEDLLDLFTRMGSHSLPSENNIQLAIERMAHKAILQEPKYIVDCFATPMACLQQKLSDKESVLSLYETQKGHRQKSIATV
ncbi:probable ubiquitin carboxyl-terminal hydrolase 5 isoform X2 [Oreochromis aureus]|uniref:Ubiquitin carboxyl-terminal hydrolase n=1 Tax=Oreochromis aureus TaxID=47969 RepID=A0AAZ1Y2D7_OREAU|nr:probable ubiquitin carboxyl-terminal hydrolase 5 isoform X2 [Oreochromis aureus]XP_039465638.1 probable ubiquitin carboxyl-terminal hydrolase 5 isoform X2 [Oreochromis aureus]XP_039465639.1 probable ubiquitin carboxyl-terminal hydrolase 5 isoform X2 [Oreochromis aureus]